MALIKCPECDNQVSDKAAACPKCGAPVDALARGDRVARADLSADTGREFGAKEAKARAFRTRLERIVLGMVVVGAIALFCYAQRTIQNARKQAAGEEAVAEARWKEARETVRRAKAREEAAKVAAQSSTPSASFQEVLKSVLHGENLTDVQSKAIAGAIKAGVLKQLKDPESARLGDIAVGEMKGDAVICGSVNAKNALGGYVGMRAFFGSFIGDEFVPKIAADDSENLVITQVCKPLYTSHNQSGVNHLRVPSSRSV